MASDGETRRLAAIMATDAVGYSRLMGDDEAATLRTLADYRKVMAETIELHRGRVIDAPGDAMLAEFASPVEAVRSASEIQRELGVRNGHLADHRRMDTRVGINLGDVIHKDGALYGDGVNVAARLEALAEPGGICISRSVRDQVRDKMDVTLEDLGEHEVKNIARPLRAFRVSLEGAGRTAAPTGGGKTGASEKPSIAILPFDNMSGDDSQEYFSDGSPRTSSPRCHKV